MHVGYVVDKVVLGQVFLQVLWFFPCQYHSTNVPCLLIYDQCYIILAADIIIKQQTYLTHHTFWSVRNSFLNDCIVLCCCIFMISVHY